VIHVRDLKATIIYTDALRSRARFIRDLLEPHHIVWRETTNGHDFQICTGSYEAPDQETLEHFLTAVGSRLVFLIDWNRARKRLSRFVRKADAIELLKWAAANNIGHQAFLKTGDIKLIHTALERANSTHVHYGARLDEILGRDGAKCFLMSVLQIASTGLSRRSSARLIDDEIEAELLMYLQRSDRTLLGAMAEHALVLAGMVERLHKVIAQLRAHHTADRHGADGDADAQLEIGCGHDSRTGTTHNRQRRRRLASPPPALGGRSRCQSPGRGRVHPHARAGWDRSIGRRAAR
jgi:hypothetical protein